MRCCLNICIWYLLFRAKLHFNNEARQRSPEKLWVWMENRPAKSHIGQRSYENHTKEARTAFKRTHRTKNPQPFHAVCVCCWNRFLFFIFFLKLLVHPHNESRSVKHIRRQSMLIEYATMCTVNSVAHVAIYVFVEFRNLACAVHAMRRVVTSNWSLKNITRR